MIEPILATETTQKNLFGLKNSNMEFRTWNNCEHDNITTSLWLNLQVSACSAASDNLQPNANYLQEFYRTIIFYLSCLVIFLSLDPTWRMASFFRAAFAALKNPEYGWKTTHFWGPVANWGLVGSAAYDAINKDADVSLKILLLFLALSSRSSCLAMVWPV